MESLRGAVAVRSAIALPIMESLKVPFRVKVLASGGSLAKDRPLSESDPVEAHSTTLCVSTALTYVPRPLHTTSAMSAD